MCPYNPTVIPTKKERKDETQRRRKREQAKKAKPNKANTLYSLNCHSARPRTGGPVTRNTWTVTPNQTEREGTNSKKAAFITMPRPRDQQGTAVLQMAEQQPTYQQLANQETTHRPLVTTKLAPMDLTDYRQRI